MGECQILFLGPESMHFENWAPNTSWGFVVVLVLQDLLYTVNCILAFVLLSAYIVWLATHCERAFTFKCFILQSVAVFQVALHPVLYPLATHCEGAGQ